MMLERGFCFEGFCRERVEKRLGGLQGKKVNGCHHAYRVYV